MGPASPNAGWGAGNNANDGLSKAFPKLTWAGAKAVLSGSDTLIISSNNYTGQYINEFANYSGSSVGFPPSGSAGNPTIIRAEFEGEVNFDGQNTYYPFAMMTDGDLDVNWIDFIGINFIRPADGYSGVYMSYGNTGVHHVRFLRCGAFKDVQSDSRTTGFYIGSGKYMLLEDCYTWGTFGRGFVFQNIHSERNAGCEKSIARRCVVRMDNATSGALNNEQSSAFISYSAEDIEFQNCLHIDGDTSTWVHMQSAVSFATRRTQGGYGVAKDCHWRGCMSLNMYGWAYPNGDTMDDGVYPLQAFSIHNEDVTDINTIENCVVWDVPVGFFFPRGVVEDQVGSPTITNCTIKCNNDPAWGGPYDSGDPGWENGFEGAYGVYQYSESPRWSFRNSIVICNQNTAVAGVLSDYNAVSTTNIDFVTGQAGAHDYTDDNSNEINPLTDGSLLYITRIEAGGGCKGTGAGGVDRGANITKRYGVDGSFWGDTGYNTLSDVDLWPWPYEDLIRSAMRTYSPVGGPSGERGFCADGETLTHYIWNYLGNGGLPADSQKWMLFY
jgi:hypothetical protein